MYNPEGTIQKQGRTSLQYKKHEIYKIKIGTKCVLNEFLCYNLGSKTI